VCIYSNFEIKKEKNKSDFYPFSKRSKELQASD